MIKYNRDAIVLHYIVEYDENGKQINKDRDLAVEISKQCTIENFSFAKPRTKDRANTMQICLNE